MLQRGITSAGVRGAVFRHVLTAEACFFKLSQPRRCFFASRCLSKAALETKLRGSGGRGTASEWNVPSWFKVQSPEPEGPRDHLRPPTHAPSILLHFHLGPACFTDGGLSLITQINAT